MREKRILVAATAAITIGLSALSLAPVQSVVTAGGMSTNVRKT